MRDDEVGMKGCGVAVDVANQAILQSFSIAYMYKVDNQKSVPIKISSQPQFCPNQTIKELKFLKIAVALATTPTTIYNSRPPFQFNVVSKHKSGTTVRLW